jgi:hypothetical protein
MNPSSNTEWHFYIMILASLLVFILIIKLLLTQPDFRKSKTKIFLLSIVVVVFGMLFGKYGAEWGLPWWIYYPVPMLLTVLLPPLYLKLSSRKTVYYIILSFLSAPFIHACFSFFLGWNEYIPFWKIPFWKTL